MRILMFFHSGSNNRGCEAIVRTAADLLCKDQCITRLALASGNPQSDSFIPHLDVIHADMPSVVEKYSAYGFVSALQVKLLKNESMAFRKIHESIIKLIPQYDVFISIGG